MTRSSRARRRSLFNDHRELLPATGDLSGFVNRVADSRSRPITLLPVVVGNAQPFGVWVATASRDYIAYPAEASAISRTAVVCHELAHMLLGHTPQPEPDGSSSLAHGLASNIDPAITARFLRRHHYEDVQEDAAEWLGTLFSVELSKRETASHTANDRVYDRMT